MSTHTDESNTDRGSTGSCSLSGSVIGRSADSWPAGLAIDPRTPPVFSAAPAAFSELLTLAASFHSISTGGTISGGKSIVSTV